MKQILFVSKLSLWGFVALWVIMLCMWLIFGGYNSVSFWRLTKSVIDFWSWNMFLWLSCNTIANNFKKPMQIYSDDEEMAMAILLAQEFVGDPFQPKTCRECGYSYTEDECPECERIAKQIEENKDDIPY